MRRRALLGGCFALALALALPACKSCKNDHPYVPYAIGDEAGPSAPSADAEVAATDASAPEAGLGAVAAPQGATRWSVGGLDLTAPDDREFALALAHDVDGDGVADVLALVTSRAAGGDRELLLFRGRAPNAPSVVLSRPGDPQERACAPVLRLAKIGRASASVEIGASCASSRSTRDVWSLRLDRGPAVSFHASVVDPPRAAPLMLDLDGADRDGDGSDDLALTIGLGAPAPPLDPGPRVEAPYLFLDRPAGLSRTAAEPAKSLEALVRRASPSRASASASALALARQARALLAALCGEPSVRRVSVNKPAEGSCNIADLIKKLALAEVRARALSGDVFRAFAAERSARARGELSGAEDKAVVALLERLAPTRAADATRTLEVTVEPHVATHPRWAPVAFESSGALLVRGAAGVVRFELATGEVAAPEVTPWPTEVRSPDGRMRWLEAYDACDGALMHATMAASEEGDVRDVLLPVAARRTRCTSRGEPVRSTPLGWGASGLAAWIDGEPVLLRPTGPGAHLASVAGQPAPKGSPRSPNGRSAAMVTARGVLVGPDRPALVTSPALAPYETLAACTVSDTRTAIACVRGAAVLYATVTAP